MDRELLINTLRTSNSLEEITHAARLLARSVNRADHKELYRMAHGDYRSFVSWYNPDHMVIGVEALVMSRCPNAKTFLEEYLRREEDNLRPGERLYGGVYSFEERNERPNMPYRLRRLMLSREDLRDRVDALDEFLDVLIPDIKVKEDGFVN